MIPESVSSTVPVKKSHTLRTCLCAIFIFTLFSAYHTVAGFGEPSPRHFTLSEFSLEQLKDPTPGDLERFREATTEVGLFAVTGHHDLSSGDVNKDSDEGIPALQNFARCIGTHGISLASSGNAMKASLRDGTHKTTVATGTNGTQPHELPAAVQASCPEFAQTSQSLRSAVDLAGRSYARLLDRLVHGIESQGITAATVDDEVDLYETAIEKAESLEHFHVFQNDASPSEQDGRAPAIDLHSDMGLFIVMTAAEYIHMASGEPVKHSSRDAVEDDGAGALMPGFYLELASGELVRPIIPPGSLLVMNGEGLERWTRKAPGSVRPHVPGHEVVLPAMEGMGRAWFGRMFLPPHDAVLQRQPGEEDLPVGMTFGEYRDQTVAAFNGGKPETASAAGCAPLRRQLAEVTDCTADQVFCWMSCMNITQELDDSCGREEIVCEDPRSGQLWPEDFLNSTTGKPRHCMSCALTCPAPDDAPNAPNDAPDTHHDEHDDHDADESSAAASSFSAAVAMWTLAFIAAFHQGIACSCHIL